LRPLLREFPEVVAQHLGRKPERVGNNRNCRVQFRQHADSLRALPWKDKGKRRHESPSCDRKGADYTGRASRSRNSSNRPQASPPSAPYRCASTTTGPPAASAVNGKAPAHCPQASFASTPTTSTSLSPRPKPRSSSAAPSSSPCSMPESPTYQASCGDSSKKPAASASV